jgi:hypothetical protein
MLVHYGRKAYESWRWGLTTIFLPIISCFGLVIRKFVQLIGPNL